VPYPCIVKACCGGSSVGVVIADNDDAYEKALSEAFRYDDEVVIEQYIKGREFSVGVIDGKAYPIIEIAPIHGFYDYKNKYQAGSTIETCPAKLSDEKTKAMQDAAEKAFRILRLKNYARMDFMMNENGDFFCLEANTLPGMTPTSLLPQEAQALGISYEDLCQMLVDISLRG
jgi:D-alanine-D-alanine ligase